MKKYIKKEFTTYFLIESVFILCYLLLVNYVHVYYSALGLYSEKLFAIFQLVLILGCVVLGPFLNKIYANIISFVFMLYMISQSVYFRAFNQYYRLKTIFTLYKEGVGAKDSILELVKYNDVKPFLVMIVLLIISIFVYIKVERKIIKNTKFNERVLIYLPRVLALLLIIPISNCYRELNYCIEESKHTEDAFQLNKTDYYIYDSIPTTNQFVEKFGLITLAYRDGLSFFEKEIFSQEDYKRIDKYLNNRSEHIDNEMTGIFKDKNVLFVMAESLNDIVIDEELTPTLHRFKNEGINIEGFNTSTMTGSTSSSEFMANTSIVPLADGDVVCYKYPYNAYPYTLATIFNDMNYITHAYHNNYGQYYNRDVVFPNLGYDRFFDCTDFGLDDHNSDSSIMDVLKWILVENNSKYMGFWITYSGHQPYDLNSTGVNRENVEKIYKKHPNLSEEYVSYIAKNMDLDHALNDLVKELEKVDKLDDFVFVVFGDHIVKSLDTTENSSFYTEAGNIPSSMDTYTDLFIYNSGTETMNYKKISTLLDLLPTIANMWGYEVDYSMVLGTDIFDKDYRGFFFGEWDYWRTDDYIFDSTNRKFYNNDDYDETKAELEMKNRIEMMEISKLMLKLDYFNKVDENEK